MKVEALMEASEEAQNYLESTPVSTQEYVKYLEYIDASIQKVDDMENELDYLKELFDIMEEFKIQIDPNDMQNYLNVSVILGSLRGTVDRKNEDRTYIVQLFNEQINKDINDLINVIGKIKESCMVRIFIFIIIFVLFSFILSGSEPLFLIHFIAISLCIDKTAFTRSSRLSFLSFF